MIFPLSCCVNHCLPFFCWWITNSISYIRFVVDSFFKQILDPFKYCSVEISALHRAKLGQKFAIGPAFLAFFLTR